jgi:aminoglycoside phosphotransferase (APT) family kinase protein
VEFEGSHAAWPVIGKVYETQIAGQRSYHGMCRLWDAGFSSQAPATVHIPQPYGYISHLRLLLMEQVPGTPLKTLVKRKRATTDDMRLFATGLAKLHQTAAVPSIPFRVDDHLTVRCDGRHEALAQAFPDIAPQVRSIVARARELELQQDARLTAVHGDFHLGQVHVADGQVWILDLDPLHFGDPAYDLAMVFVMMKHLALKMEDGVYIRSLRDAFIEAYFSPANYNIAQRVPLHAALIHLKRACKRFRYQDEPGWHDTVRRQIGEGALCMEQMTAGILPRSAADVAALYDGCPATV